jgi:hypothetical protein
MSRELRDEIDREAEKLAMNRSEWVLDVIMAVLRRRPRGRTVVVEQRQRIRVRTPQRLCSHPPQLRSEKGPNGEARCMGCDAIFRAYR